MEKAGIIAERTCFYKEGWLQTDLTLTFFSNPYPFGVGVEPSSLETLSASKIGRQVVRTSRAGGYQRQEGKKQAAKEIEDIGHSF